MGVIGSLVGAGINAIGQGIAAGKMNKGYREQRKMYNNRLNDVKAHRDAVYYQDPTQSAENQAAVTQAAQVLEENARRVAGANAVAGGTDESAALAKGQAVATVGNMMQQQAVENAAKKERAWSEADRQIDNFTKYIAESKVAQAQGQAKAITDTANKFGEVANEMAW